MINTLRITSIIASCLAIVFLSLSVFLGLKPDPAKADFITELTKFNNEKLTNSSGIVSNKTDSPLVLQAQAYTLKVNPPKPREEVSVAAIRQEPEVRFKLLGTAFYPKTPEKNIALIDSPGKGQHWVKVNEDIEGIKIEKILDGKVIYKKNGKSIALTTGNKPGNAEEVSEEVVVEDQNPSVIPVATEPVQVSTPTPVQVSTPTPEEQRRKEHQDTMAFLKQIAADQNGSEAAQLGDLKEFMNEVEKEFNAQETADTNAQGGADPMAPSADENGSAGENDANTVNTEQQAPSVTADAAVSQANENGEVNAKPAPEPVQKAAPPPGESRSRMRPRTRLRPTAAAGTE